MKNIWMLIVLFAVAGCQPEVQESPAATPAPVAKSDVQLESALAAIPPAPHVMPEQPKAAPEKPVVKPAVVVPPEVAAPAVTTAPAKTEKTVTAEPVPAPQLRLSEADAMALAKKKNCFACHALDKKVVGPAWKAVAEKYRGDAGAQAALESKVRKGGKGNWGSIAMPPQTALSEEELKGLVQFVLQLQ